MNQQTIAALLGVVLVMGGGWLINVEHYLPGILATALGVCALAFAFFVYLMLKV